VTLPFSLLDWVALSWFVIAWAGFGWIVDGGRFGPTLTQAMELQRKRWMRTMLTRDLRIVDTSIMAGLQNGTAFFASTALLALGGAFTLASQADRLVAVFDDLPIHVATSTAVVELKVIGLILIYAYAFFKFGWAYRLFNYASILIGTVPMSAHRHEPAVIAAADRAAAMQITASRHFNRGLRAFFFSLAYLGWFIGAIPLVIASTFILVILLHRQYRSDAHRAAWAGLETPADTEPDPKSG
jgi:uncharacterized membrane protein